MNKFLSTLNQYKEEGKLYSQVHPSLPLTIWNYTPKVQYEGLWDDITLMCRGLVTDNSGKIWARPFMKFFNLEENRHTPTDNFEIFEKLDGSLIIGFWYNGEFVLASRGSFTSDHALKAKEILDSKYPKFRAFAYPNTTYCFELIGFEQIVVSYPKIDLILTGRFELIRDDWKEIELFSSESLFLSEIPIVKRYTGLDWKSIKNLNWTNAEGFVVRFSNGSRCKIKFDDYIRLHRVMTNISEKKIWEALKDGTPISSILENVPDEFFDSIKESEKRFLEKYSEIEEGAKERFEFEKKMSEDRKEFAKNISKFPAKSVLFAMLDGKDYSKIIWKILEP
jgi:RNA ligase